MKALRVLLAILAVCLFSVRAFPDALYKPWDKNFKAIQRVLHEVIPAAFQPAGKAVMIESVPADEAHTALSTIYDDDDDVDGLLGLYLPRPTDGPPGLPEFGSIILLIGDMKGEVQGHKTAEYVVSHEYGHWVYFELLTKAERKEWEGIWKEEDELHCHPTDYAGGNEWEGFAETFATYCWKGKQLTAVSRDFLDKVAKRLKP